MIHSGMDGSKGKTRFICMKPQKARRKIVPADTSIKKLTLFGVENLQVTERLDEYYE